MSYMIINGTPKCKSKSWARVEHEYSDSVKANKLMAKVYCCYPEAQNGCRCYEHARDIVLYFMPEASVTWVDAAEHTGLCGR